MGGNQFRRRPFFMLGLVFKNEGTSGQCSSCEFAREKGNMLIFRQNHKDYKNKITKISGVGQCNARCALLSGYRDTFWGTRS